mgnify:CR=1 FL=1
MAALWVPTSPGIWETVAMNEQTFLFPMPSADVERPHRAEPGCHAGDPETSFQAAARLKASGRLGRQQRTVLEALRQCDGSTHAELGAFMGVHWLTPARRLPELERAGLVRKGTPRICRIKHSRCCTWWVTEGETA